MMQKFRMTVGSVCGPVCAAEVTGSISSVGGSATIVARPSGRPGERGVPDK